MKGKLCGDGRFSGCCRRLEDISASCRGAFDDRRGRRCFARDFYIFMCVFIEKSRMYARFCQKNSKKLFLYQRNRFLQLRVPFGANRCRCVERHSGTPCIGCFIREFAACTFIWEKQPFSLQPWMNLCSDGRTMFPRS